MIARERQLATIRHELTDRVSVDAIHVENQAEVACLLGIEQPAVLPRLGLDGRIVSAAYRGTLLPQQEPYAISKWGTPNTGDYGTARVYPLTPTTSLAEVERYPWPDAAQYDYAEAAQVAADLAREYAVRGPYWKPLFCQVCDLLGMEEAMFKMRAEPTVFEAILERVCDHTIAFCQRLLAACGDALPILCLGDDFATQRGLMISPSLWRVFLKPRYARLFALGKSAGKFVWFHSCGDITAVLPDLIEIGMDVWETVQLHALPLSPETLKREFGRHLTFFGGVNTQRLPFISPAEVRAEVTHCIEVLGKGGGYICGPDHHIKPDVSPQNTLALFDTARAFRGPGYTL
jgi:uroporphyrinogen decarboxylase